MNKLEKLQLSMFHLLLLALEPFHLRQGCLLFKSTFLLPPVWLHLKRYLLHLVWLLRKEFLLPQVCLLNLVWVYLLPHQVLECLLHHQVLECLLSRQVPWLLDHLLLQEVCHLHLVECRIPQEVYLQPLLLACHPRLLV